MRLYTLASVCALLFLACVPKSELVRLEPPLTPILTSKSIWGVTNESYVRVFAEPETGSELFGLLRQGDIVEVLKKRGDGNGEYWLEIRPPSKKIRGWVRNANLDVYDTAPQAQTARNAFVGHSISREKK